MRYQYVYAAEIRGLLPPGDTEITIDIPSIGGSITYTGDVDSIPEVADLRTAVGQQLLAGFVGDRTEDLKRAVLSIRRNRHTHASHQVIAIVRATGEVEDFELKFAREDDEFIVCLGDTPTKDIQRSCRKDMQPLLTALRLASRHFDKNTDRLRLLLSK
jgi:hypothetical protein